MWETQYIAIVRVCEKSKLVLLQRYGEIPNQCHCKDVGRMHTTW
jgi:hypothetical protein